VQMALKLTQPHRRAGPGGSHPIMNEWGGVLVVPSQVRVIWPIPRYLHEPPTFPTSSLPQTPQRDNIPKILFWGGVVEGG
jgi:hypothetical protein